MAKRKNYSSRLSGIADDRLSRIDVAHLAQLTPSPPWRLASSLSISSRGVPTAAMGSFPAGQLSAWRRRGGATAIGWIAVVKRSIIVL